MSRLALYLLVIAAHSWLPTAASGIFSFFFPAVPAPSEQILSPAPAPEPKHTTVALILEKAYAAYRLGLKSSKERRLLRIFGDRIITSHDYRLHKSFSADEFAVDVPSYLESPWGEVAVQQLIIRGLLQTGTAEATYILSDSEDDLVVRFSMDCRHYWQGPVHELVRDFLFTAYLADLGNFGSELPTAVYPHMVSLPEFSGSEFPLPYGVLLKGQFPDDDEHGESVQCKVAYMVTEDAGVRSFANWKPRRFKDVMLVFLAAVEAIERMHVDKDVVHGQITADRIVFLSSGEGGSQLVVGFTHLGKAVFSSDYFSLAGDIEDMPSAVRARMSHRDFYRSPYFSSSSVRSFRNDLWALIMSISLVMNGHGLYEYVMELPSKSWTSNTFKHFIKNEFIFKYPGGPTFTDMLPIGTDRKVTKTIKDTLADILAIARNVEFDSQVPKYSSIRSAISSLIQIL